MLLTFSLSTEDLQKIVFANIWKHSDFILGTEFTGSLAETNPDDLFACYRLIGTLYFLKHRTAFPKNNLHQKSHLILQRSHEKDNLQIHLDFSQKIRENVWDRIVNEDEMTSTEEA